MEEKKEKFFSRLLSIGYFLNLSNGYQLLLIAI
jgi:hypothetical protein